MFSFIKTFPPCGTLLLEIFTEMVGEPENDNAQLTLTSPPLNAEKINTPLFFARRAKDQRVNKA